MIWVAVIVGYVVVSFVASAMVVRFLPGTRTAKTIRRSLGLFFVLPIIILLNLGRMGLGASGKVSASVRALFERLSGRKLHERKHQYHYYSSSRSRRKS